MRLLCTLQDQNEVKRLSDFLHSKGIENEIDGSINSDWGSTDYGLIDYKIWIKRKSSSKRLCSL